MHFLKKRDYVQENNGLFGYHTGCSGVDHFTGRRFFGDGQRTRDRLEAADGRRCRANRDDLRGLAGLAQSEVVVIFNTIV